MNKIITILNTLFASQSVRSALRHAVVMAGAWLTSKGFSNSNWVILSISTGVIFSAGATLWGAINEYIATGSWKHFGFSITRHVLEYVGVLAVASGWLGEDTATNIIAFIVPILTSIWGVGDEVMAEIKE